MTKLSPPSDTTVQPPSQPSGSLLRSGGEPYQLCAAELASAFENAAVAMVLMGPDGERLRANQACCRMFGGTESELLAGAWPATHPDDAGADPAQRASCLAGLQQSYRLQKRYLHRDGRVIWAEKSCTLVRGGDGRPLHFICQVQDITERKLAEEALRRSEERFRSLTMLSSNWYWEQDEQFRFVAFRGVERPGVWRPTERLFLGRTRWEVPGLRALSMSWDEHRAVVQARQTFHEFQTMRVRADGTPVYVSSSGEAVFDEQGRFTGYRGTSRDITADKVAETRLRDAQGLLHMAARMGRLGAWAYELGKCHVTWSDELCAIHEVEGGFAPTPDQVIGFFASEFQPSLRARMEACLREGTPFDIQAKATTSGGRALWMRVIGEAERDERGQVRRIRGAGQDISDSKEAAERAQLVADQLTTTLESLTDGFFTLDRDWRFTYVNAESERLVRRTRGEMLGRRFIEVFPDTSAAPFSRHFKTALQANAAVQAEEYYAPLDVWLHVKVYPSRQGLAVYVRDVTERVLAQREMLRLNAELEARVKERTVQLELANKELEAFAYSIAHDLRAPLGAINGFSECLERTAGSDLDERSRHYLGRIRAGVGRMQDLTEGLLALASLSRASLRNRNVDLASLARDAIAACRERSPQRQADIELAPSLPAYGDPRLLAQVMENLLGNAWKFTAGRERARIEVGSRPGAGGSVEYFVRDNGAGFDMEYAAKLFEPFQRLHTQDEFPGTGIGLAIVHKVVTRHGGRIWAESTPDHGASFFFTLR